MIIDKKTWTNLSLTYKRTVQLQNDVTKEITFVPFGKTTRYVIKCALYEHMGIFCTQYARKSE